MLPFTILLGPQGVAVDNKGTVCVSILGSGGLTSGGSTTQTDLPPLNGGFSEVSP